MKRNTNKRTKSISRKINREIVLTLLSSFLLIDLLLVVLSAFFWCYSIESAGGKKLELSSTRYFTSITQLEEEAAQETKKKAKEKSGDSSAASGNYAEALAEYEAASQNTGTLFPSIQPAKTFLVKAVYVYEDDSGEKQYAYAGGFLRSLLSCLFLLAMVELLLSLSAALTGARKIRRQLAPLDELAFKAEMLGNAAALDQQALEDLERAIDAISPAGDGAHLHTGNAEMIELERAVNGLLDRMRESYKQQSRFVSDASHELRTPISVLQGYVNLLDRWGKEDEKILEESIEAIKSETEHMKKLVEQLLFLARGDSGKTKLTMERFSLNDMMQEVFEESIMIDDSHTYRFLPCEDSLLITGDVSMLKQTARILIDNASRYAPEDSVITLKTSLEFQPDANLLAGIPLSSFSIQDEGIGIADGDAAHMFERFYRSDPARTKDGGGTGLGLSIAKWIVDRHGGYFQVLSRPEIGSRITVSLPQKDQKDQNNQNNQNEKKR